MFCSDHEPSSNNVSECQGLQDATKTDSLAQQDYIGTIYVNSKRREQCKVSKQNKSTNVKFCSFKMDKTLSLDKKNMWCNQIETLHISVITVSKESFGHGMKVSPQPAPPPPYPQVIFNPQLSRRLSTLRRQRLIS